MNADTLGRMLRLLSAYGLFERQARGYGNTAASQLLKSNHPESLRSYARMISIPLIWNGFTQFGQAATTGQPAQSRAGSIAYFSTHPQEAVQGLLGAGAGAGSIRA
jgi:hypothetical protein